MEELPDVGVSSGFRGEVGNERYERTLVNEGPFLSANSVRRMEEKWRARIPKYMVVSN